MATLGWYDYRDPNFDDLAKFPVLKELYLQQYYPKIIEIWLQQEAADAVAEIMVNYTAIFDGTGTAAVVYYDSSSANDAAAGVGIRTIDIFGINEDGDDFQVVTDSMAGLTGTATAEKWQRLNHFKGVTAGANGDAEGTVTIQDDAAGTNKHMTIAATAVCSVSARVYIPDGWNMWMARVEAHQVDAAHATEEFLTMQGFVFYPIIADTSTAIGHDEVGSYSVVTEHNKPCVYTNLTPIITGDNSAYISLKHVSKQADANATAFYKIFYIAYPTSAARRGVG